MALKLQVVTTKTDGDLTTPSIPTNDLGSSYPTKTVSVGQLTYKQTTGAMTIYGTYQTYVQDRIVYPQLYVNGESKGTMANLGVEMDHIYGYKISPASSPDNIRIDVATVPTYNLGDSVSIGRLNIDPSIKFIKDNHSIYMASEGGYGDIIAKEMYGMPIFYCYSKTSSTVEHFTVIFICCEKHTNNTNNTTWEGLTMHAYDFSSEYQFSNSLITPLDVAFPRAASESISAIITEPSEQANQIAALQDAVATLTTEVNRLNTKIIDVASATSKYFVSR